MVLQKWDVEGRRPDQCFNYFIFFSFLEIFDEFSFMLSNFIAQATAGLFCFDGDEW